MASVRIRIDDFEDGLLPGICASSGRAGARLYKADISSRGSGWAWLLVFAGPIGIVAALLLTGALKRTAHGYLPYREEVQDVIRLRSRRYAQGLVGSLALLTAAFVLTVASRDFRPLSVLLGVAGVIAAVGFAFFWANVPGSVGGHLDGTGRWIELDPVAPAFAAAYDAQEAHRRASRRDERLNERRLDR